MPFLGFRSTKSPAKNAHWTIPEAKAFDVLIALALKMERDPNDILHKGEATGFSERVRMLAETFDWDFKFQITDKQGRGRER